MINLLHSNHQLKKAVSSPGLVVIDIYKEQECKKFDSKYKKIPVTFPQVSFYRIDEASFSAFKSFASAADISSLPTLLVYSNGQILVKTSVSSPSLVELLIEHCYEEYLKGVF